MNAPPQTANEDEVSEFEATVLVRKPKVWRRTLVPAGLVVVMSVGIAGASPVAGAIMLVLGILALIAVDVRDYRASEEALRVIANHTGLRISTKQGEETIPRSSITDARSSFERGKHIVRIVAEKGRKAFEGEARSEHEATRLIRVLALDAGRLRISATTKSSLERRTACLLTAPVLIVTALVTFGAFPILPFVLLFFVGLIVGATLAPGHIEIAADGISHDDRWRRRFIAFDEIRSFELEADAIHLDLVSGERVRIPRVMANGGTAAAFAYLGAGWEARRKGNAAPHAVHAIEPGKREPALWLRDLKRLRDAGKEAALDTYRANALRAEDLWSVVEAPEASAAARAGAAVLLRPLLDEEGRARLRIASQAVASPKLRVALEKASEVFESVRLDEEDELDEHVLDVARDHRA